MENNWFLCEQNSKIGLVPPSYISKINIKDTPSHGSIIPPPTSICVALYDFHATNEHQLSFKKDDKMNLIEKSREQWWKVELNGKQGMVPVNYVREEKLAAPRKSVEVQPTQTLLPAPPSLSSKIKVNPVAQYNQSQANQSNHEHYNPKSVSTIFTPPNASKEAKRDFRRSVPVISEPNSHTPFFSGSINPPLQHPEIFPRTSFVGICIALYDYEAQNEHQLSFKKDDKMNLIEKSQEQWWKVELNGKQGMVPITYIKEEGAPEAPNMNASVSASTTRESKSPRKASILKEADRIREPQYVEAEGTRFDISDTKEMEQLLKALIKKTSTIEQLENKVASLESNLESERRDRNRVSEFASSLESTIRKLDQDVKNQINRVDELENSVRQSMDKISTIEVSLPESKDSYSSEGASKDLSNLQIDMKDVKEEVTQHRTTFSVIQSQLSKLQVTVKQIERQQEESNSHKSDFRSVLKKRDD